VIACGFILAGAAVAAYSRTFSVPLLFDDGPSVADNPTLRHLGAAFWPPGGSTVNGRPILNLSLALNYAISGTAVWSYHAANLVIHILAGLTLFGILRRTLSRLASPAAPAVAFSAALLWTLHPLLTESVTYIVQRAESLMGLFYLLTVYAFIRGSGIEGPARRRWYALSIGACALGMGTKEVMVSAPLVVLLYDRTFLAGNFREAWRRRWPLYAGLASTWLILLLLVLGSHGRGGSAGFGTWVPWWRYGLTQSAAILHYLRLCLWPHPLVFDYGTALAPASLRILPDVLAVAALLAATGWALVRRPALGFLGAVFFAILAPSSSILSVVTETMAEHRMYLPLIPVAVLAVAGLYRWAGRAALPACLVLAACLLGATWERNEVYLSVDGIWSDTVAKRPENDRAHNNLGSALREVPGGLNRAIAQFKEALRLNPDRAETHFNLAIILDLMPDRSADAIAQYGEALRLWPDYAQAHYNLGCDLDKLPGHATEAIAHFEEAVRLKPSYAEAHYNLGCDLARVPGRLDDAVTQFKEALRLKADYPEAHYNLGFALDKSGRTDDAIAQYTEAVRLKPDLIDAHYLLGCDLDKLPHRTDEAIGQYQAAVRLRPAFAEAHFNLGIDLEKTPTRTGEAVEELQEAVRLIPDFAQAHYGLGNALFFLGRTQEAVTQYEETLRLSPDIAMAHCNLGNALGALGRTPEAIAQFKEALRLNPDSVEARFNLGNALSSQGRFSEAITAFEAAARLKPDEAAIHFNLALALLRTPGRGGEAAAHLREVVRLQPDNDQARQILARMGPPPP
jgi:tetratricopeptide (TPR) repeat protein